MHCKFVRFIFVAYLRPASDMEFLQSIRRTHAVSEALLLDVAFTNHGSPEKQARAAYNPLLVDILVDIAAMQ